MLLKLKVWIIPEEGRNLLKVTHPPLVRSTGDDSRAGLEQPEWTPFFIPLKEFISLTYIDNNI